MSPLMIGILAIIILLVLLFLGVPIGFSMLAVGFFGYLLVTQNFSAAIGVLKTVPFTTTSSYTLSVIPLFVLMGQIIYYAGISSELYNTCYKWLGRLRGGLAMATIVASAGFAAICGSSTATTATMGVVCYPEMKKYKYADTLSTGAISAGGTLGVLIPPSTGFILFGTAAQVAVGKMFIAGILPGILMTVLYLVVIVVITTVDPKAGPKGEKFTIVEKIKSLTGVLPIIILFLIVLGGIFVGWFTPTEGGAIGAFGSFVFMIIRRKFTLSNLKMALADTLKTSAMILFIMVGANTFNAFLTVTNMPTALASWAVSLPVAPVVVLLLILVVYAILGCFVDSLPLITLLVPIFLPVIHALNMDVIWFGVLMVMLMMLGSVTPPVGICCYVMSGVAKEVPLQRIFKGTLPFIAGLVATVVLVLIFPAIATWLPAFMAG